MPKSIYKTIRLTPELAEWVEKTAKAQGRSQCNLMMKLVDDGKYYSIFHPLIGNESIEMLEWRKSQLQRHLDIVNHQLTNVR